jgi:prefoldin subunit 5
MALGVKTKIGHAINSINSADAELSMVIEDMETAISDLGDRMSAEEDREERRASKKTKTAKKRK